MDLAELTAKAAQALADGTDFDKTIKFDFGTIGKLFIDGINNVASNEDVPADATIKVDWDDFIKLAKGALDPAMAFMSGKIKVEGDMSVAMKLQSLFKQLQ